MKKQTSRAFGKKVFLLGADSDGIYYWLEEAKWDCGWYWGFGYIETYTRNKQPNLAKDINSHQHAEQFYGKWWDSVYTGILKETTFSEKEGWELAELFKQFYFLKEAAEYFTRGKSNIANTALGDFKKLDLVKEINEVRIPDVFKRIYEILEP